MGGASWGQRGSHLTDVVVDGVCVPLACGVARVTKHVLVGVDLAHWHVDAVVRSLCSVRRDRLFAKEKKASG